MGKYGESAEIAIKIILSKKETNPIKAWELAVAEIYPDSKSSRKKGCPRNTFLGMCEEGLITGIKPGNYTRSKKNKSYAIKALSLLSANEDLASNTKKLWELVIEDQQKTQNSQMDIIVTLWQKKLFNLESLQQIPSQQPT